MIKHELNCKELVWQAIIQGQPVSKSNSSQVARTKYGGIFIAKSKRAKSYIEQFEMEILQKQLRPATPIDGDLCLVAYLFYKDNRSDLDASQVNDCLQKFGIIKNDRQLKIMHLYRYVAKDNARAEIYLYRLAISS